MIREGRGATNTNSETGKGCLSFEVEIYDDGLASSDAIMKECMG